MEVQISRLAQISAINQAPLSGDMLCRVSYDILDHAWVLNFPLSASSVSCLLAELGGESYYRL